MSIHDYIALKWQVALFELKWILGVLAVLAVIFLICGAYSWAKRELRRSRRD